MIKQYEIPIIRTTISGLFNTNKIHVRTSNNKLMISYNYLNKCHEFDMLRDNVFIVIGKFIELKQQHINNLRSK